MINGNLIFYTVAEIVVAHRARSRTSEDDLINEFCMALGMDSNLPVSCVRPQLLQCIRHLEQPSTTARYDAISDRRSANRVYSPNRV